MFPDREHFGRIFYNQATMSGEGNPQIAVVMGSCTAGGAYVPAMCDESIIVREQGTIFLAGPPLVKAAIGEIVSAEELGGADVHTRVSGVADHFAHDDRHALAIARAHRRQSRSAQAGDARRGGAGRAVYPAEEIYGVINADIRKPYDVREVIARIVDDSVLDEFKTRYGATLVTGFARLWGYPVGIVANNGVLYSESAQKGAHFIELCAQRGHSARVPAEHHRLHGRNEIRGGRHRQGRRQDGDGRLLRQRAEVHRDHRRQLRRRQLRHVRPGVRSAIPLDVAERAIWVMGGEQAARVLATVKRDGIEAKGGKTGAPRRRRRSRRRSASARARRTPVLRSSARLWDDGVIDPVDTRRVLGLAISASLNRPIAPTKFGVFRM